MLSSIAAALIICPEHRVPYLGQDYISPLCHRIKICDSSDTSNTTWKLYPVARNSSRSVQITPTPVGPTNIQQQYYQKYASYFTSHHIIMASYESRRSSKVAPSPTIAPVDSRRQSTMSNISTTSHFSSTSARVQLIPHARHPSYDAALSPSDIDLLDNTNFDSKDMSSKDFDFEDVFTYDKPQRKLKSVVEVSSPTRDWSNYSFTHYQSAVNVRQKYHRSRSSNGELMMKSKSHGETRKR